MQFNISERLKKLPPYLFVELDRKKAEVVSRGVDVIDLGIGDPDLATPDFIVEKLKETVSDPECHHYPASQGMFEFRQAASKWLNKRFGLTPDPNNQVVALIGSKEAIAHFPLAFLEPGDVVLVPTPAYPVYHIGTLFAGGESYFMDLLPQNNFLPDLDSIPSDILNRAKIMWLNYPNNPTAALATEEFFEEVVEFANKHNIIICHDAAYTEMTFDEYRAPSFLNTPGAMNVGIEFHSLSKTYSMTGWRIGFAVGNSRLIAGLRTVKSNVDSGQFNPIQYAAIAALESDQSCVRDMCNIYQERRDVLVEGLKSLGIEANSPKATFYVWAPVPDGYSSMQFTELLLEKAGIVATPGNGFGDPGEGFIRMALTVSKERIAEAVDRMKAIL